MGRSEDSPRKIAGAFDRAVRDYGVGTKSETLSGDMIQRGSTNSGASAESLRSTAASAAPSATGEAAQGAGIGCSCLSQLVGDGDGNRLDVFRAIAQQGGD